MMDTKSFVAIIAAIIAAAVAFWYLVLRTKSATGVTSSSSTTTTTSTSPISPITSTIIPPCPISSTSSPNVTSVTVQNFYIIPIQSENFAIEIDPAQTSTSVTINVWLSMYNDTDQHPTNLYILENITTTQPIIITSQQLSNKGIPYQGYPYIVVNVYPSAIVRYSFV